MVLLRLRGSGDAEACSLGFLGCVLRCFLVDGHAANHISSIAVPYLRSPNTSADVVDVSKKYLPRMAKGFDDKRVTVFIGDGFQFLKDHQDSYDVIITDSSDPVGPASVLFETPFYDCMYSSLRDGGIVCTQGECMWLHLGLIRPLIQKISAKYTTVEYAYTTIPTYPSGQIGFIIATKNKSDGCSSAARVPDEKTEKELQYYSKELHSAAFVLPAFARRAIFEDGGKKK